MPTTVSYKKSVRAGLALTLVAAMAALALEPSAADSAASAHAVRLAGHAGEYRNPALNRDFPDPTVIRAANGAYYAYATETDRGGRHIDIQVAKSRDLVHWRWLGDALRRLPAWGDDSRVSWAPHVVRRGHRYFLFYSIVPDKLADSFGLCLAVATSRAPAGPFRTTGKPLYCGPTLADIDPAIFRDPATKRWHMYWGSGGDIVTSRLAPSLTRLASPDKSPRLLLRGWSSPVHRPFEHGIEGPFVVARHGWYYLFYSGNKCCSYPPHYAAMVARSRHAVGPFHRLAETRPGLNSVVLHSNHRWAGPGHNSVIRDDKGRDWMVFHAIDRNRPFLPNSDAVRRPMLIARILYRHGWPTIATDSPPLGWKPAPIVR